MAALSYDPARIAPNGTYVVRAQIRAEGRLLFTSTSSYPVITRGTPTSGLQVLVRRAGDGPGAPPGPPPARGLPATGGATGSAVLLLSAPVLVGLGLGWRWRRSSPPGWAGCSRPSSPA